MPSVHPSPSQPQPRVLNASPQLDPCDREESSLESAIDDGPPALRPVSTKLAQSQSEDLPSQCVDGTGSAIGARFPLFRKTSPPGKPHIRARDPSSVLISSRADPVFFFRSKTNGQSSIAEGPVFMLRTRATSLSDPSCADHQGRVDVHPSDSASNHPYELSGDLGVRITNKDFPSNPPKQSQQKLPSQKVTDNFRDTGFGLGITWRKV